MAEGWARNPNAEAVDPVRCAEEAREIGQVQPHPEVLPGDLGRVRPRLVDRGDHTEVMERVGGGAQANGVADGQVEPVGNGALDGELGCRGGTLEQCQRQVQRKDQWIHHGSTEGTKTRRCDGSSRKSTYLETDARN
jgi:hypothetical protein